MCSFVSQKKGNTRKMDHCLQDGEKQNDDEPDGTEFPTKVKASMAVFKNLAQTLQKQQFCDLIFELTGSIKFHTHRLVFALWSPVMMNMLNQSSCRVEKVLVKTNLQDAFKQFVHFLYTGTFDGNITDIQGVLLLASTFQIPLLRDLCEKHLQQTLAVDNVISLFHTSIRFQLSCLEWHCVEHIRQHLPEVAQQSELKDLTPEQFNTFLASQHVSKLNPEMKLFLIISWLTEQVADRQHFLVLLLGHIDWSTVAQDFLTEISQTENFFTSHPSSLYLLLQTLHSASISLGPYADRFEELRKEHSEILNNVVSSSVHIGTGRHETFQPIPLTVISGPNRERISLSNKKSVINRSVETKVKIKPDIVDEADISFEQSVSKNVSESKKRVENTDSKEKGQSNSDSVSLGSSSQNGDKKSSQTHSSRAATESGSMRRKTLRPRKVVSNNSVSILSNKSVSSKRGGGSQKSKDNSNSNSTVHVEEIDLDGNLQGDTEGDDDQSEIFGKGGDPDDTDDEIVPNKRLRKARPKLEFGKSKMGRPRKGYERNKFPCPQCEYVTRHSYLLDKHIRQVHESKRIIKCPICEFQCNWSKKLYLHMRADHYNNSGPPFVCDIQECSYTSDKMNKLVEHRRSHTGDRPFMCDECKMSFRSKSNLYAHLKCHNDDKNFQCPKCQRSFKLKITLKQHLVVHDETRPYLCDLCGFATKFHSHLVAHKRKHTGDVFPCTFPSCTYTTPKKSTLQAHMRSHLGIRQHVCDTCGKAFIEKSHLVRHKRIHTTEKQHKCMLCDYASHRQDKLREHMQKHEREANRNLADKDGNKGTLAEPKKRRRRKKEDTQAAKCKDVSLPLGSEEMQESTTLSLSSTPNLPVQGTVPVCHEIPSSNINTGSMRSSASGSVAGSAFGHENRNPMLPLKQEKDWNDFELLARMGFTATEGQNSSMQVRGNRGEDTSATMTGINNCLTDFSEIFRGFETSSSGSGGPPLHPNTSIPHQVPETQSRVNVNPSEGNFPTPNPPRSVMLNSFTSQDMLSVQQRAKNPHPLIMIPNMTPPITTPQPYLHHHHHHHHQNQSQVTQQQQLAAQQQQQPQDEDQHYHPRHPTSLSHQQLLQQQGNQNNQRSSNFTHFSGYPY